MEKVLSEIVSDKKNKDLIKNIYLLAIFFLIGTMITGLFDLLNSYKLFKAYTNFSSNSPGNFKIQLIANIIFLVLYGVALPLQAYFFFRFASKLNEPDPNAETCYSTFNYLLRQAFIAAILFGLNAIWAIIDVIYFY